MKEVNAYMLSKENELKMKRNYLINEADRMDPLEQNIEKD